MLAELKGLWHFQLVMEKSKNDYVKSVMLEKKDLIGCNSK